jgi:hypothetical protein
LCLAARPCTRPHQRPSTSPCRGAFAHRRRKYPPVEAVIKVLASHRDGASRHRNEEACGISKLHVNNSASSNLNYIKLAKNEAQDGPDLLSSGRFRFRCRDDDADACGSHCAHFPGRIDVKNLSQLAHCKVGIALRWGANLVWVEEFWRATAAWGHPTAQYKLGVLLYRRADSGSIHEAETWWRVAAAAGHLGVLGRHVGDGC